MAGATLGIIVFVILGCAARPVPSPQLTPAALSLRQVGVIEGTFGTKPLAAPTALAFDISNNLYILDRGNNRLVKLNADFSFALENGGYGLGINGLNNPVSLATDGGIVFYILDQGNHRIVRSDYNLVFSDEVRFNFAPELQELGKVAALACSRFGQMYLLDPDNLKVIVLDKDYARQQELFPAGGFGRCEAIGVGAEGDVFVYDSERRAIYVFDSFGNLADDIGLPESGRLGGFALRTDQIVATDAQRHELVVLDRDGNTIAATGSLGSGPLQFSAPAGVAVRNDGRIFVCDSGNNRIVMYEIAASLP